jgi:hypothetical protein
MGLLFVLQNVFERSPTGNPFEAERNVSLFNQVIATRKVGSAPYSPSKRALYFFAYGPLVKCGEAAAPKSCEGGDVPIVVGGQFQDDGAIGLGLKATFDARNPETEAPGKDFYYLPRSCEDCHGKSIANGKVNYLDTDHWFDRVKPSFGLADGKFSQEDFTALTQLEALNPPRHGILYDGGPDLTTAQFKKAFEVFRKLNADIKGQNADAAVNPDVAAEANFPLRAVTKWLELHDPALPDATRHVPPHERGFGPQPWDPASEQDRILLYYLDRYCYRCHSSIKYNVFERREVARRKGDIEARVTEIQDATIWMPQDRLFPGLTQTEGLPTPTGDLKQFLDLLQQLQ